MMLVHHPTTEGWIEHPNGDGEGNPKGKIGKESILNDSEVHIKAECLNSNSVTLVKTKQSNI